jgi:hypothetical protein
MFIIVLLNKPKGCGAFVASTAGPSPQKNHSTLRNIPEERRSQVFISSNNY